MTTLKKFCTLLILIELFLTKAVFAAVPNTVNYSDESIPLRLKTGFVTEAEFPEKIANVTKSVSSDTLQIETLENRMFLLPLKDFNSKIYVVTQDNDSYCLHLIIDEAQGATRIKIKKRTELRNQQQAQETASTVELMKILMRGEEPLGAVSFNSDRKEVFNNEGFRVFADKVYEFANGAKAFVLIFENLTDKPIVVPIEHLELPGLVAISIESSILEARSRNAAKKGNNFSSKAYMIVGPKN